MVKNRHRQLATAQLQTGYFYRKRIGEINEKNLICSLICVFALAATAQADRYTLTWDVTPNAATAADGTWFHKVIGNLDAGPGGKVSGMDFNFSGEFYQDWLFNGLFPSTYSVMFGNAAPEVDTHLLFDNTQIIGDVTVIEDNDKSMSASAGLGTSIVGDVAIKIPYRTQSVDFIQMYVKSGSRTKYTIYTPGGNFEGGTMLESFPMLWSSLTPDVAYSRVDTPATLTLSVENVGDNRS